MSNPPKRNLWDFSKFRVWGDCLLKDKPSLITVHMLYMLMRSQQIFKWKGLPDTIPEMELELLLQQNGYAIIANVPDKGLYAFAGGLGGQQNAYYRPTIATVANPYLNFNENLEIGKNCVVIKNDPFYLGVLPLFQINAEQQAETDISLKFAEINSRIEAFLIADTDQGREDAQKVLNKIVAGEELGVIGDKALYDGIKSIAYSGRPAGNIKDLMELKQYYKSQSFIDMGLNANFNMKREAINETESQMGVDALLPLVHEWLAMRKEGASEMNSLFGINAGVDFGEIWQEAEKDAEREEQGDEDSKDEETKNEETGETNNE